jgi:hypothetical protein
MTQEICAHKFIAEHQMSNTNSLPTPYQSGMTINNIPKSRLAPLEQGTLTSKYQSLIGSLLWLTYDIWP